MSELTRQLVFHGTQQTAVLMWHLGVIAIGVALIVLLSHYERRLISRSLGWWLLGLRLSVLAVVLMTLFQPTLSWTWQKTNSSRILVGIDLSESMATSDRQATSGEKLRIARGLGMIGNPSINTRLDGWQAAFDSGQQPDWVDPAESDDELQRELLESSRRESLESIFREIEKISRKEIARRLLVAAGDPLLDELSKVAQIELFVFAGQSESIDQSSLADVIEHPSVSLATSTSDLSAGLQRGLESHGEVQGVVLLTDGRDHSNKNLLALAATLKGSNTPVFPILLGSHFRPKDLAVVYLEHPGTAYKGDRPKLTAWLSTYGFEGGQFDVELVSDDHPEAAPIRKSVTPDSALTHVDFELDAEKLGLQNYTVRIPVQEGETQDDNNSRSFSFTVVDDRAKVLLIDGDARWEFRYLDAALARDERIDLQQILFHQPHLGVLPEPFFPQQLKLPADPTDLAASLFAERDLIIIGDVSPSDFPDAAWQLLLRFVTEGGTVILSAGQRHMPLSHRSTALQQLLPMTNLVPVYFSDQSQESAPRNRGLALQLSSDGEKLPMLQFAPDLSQNIAIWKGLPGQMWALLGEAKPATTVWGTTLVPAGRIEGLNADRKFGVIIHQFVGAGQVVWLGIDSTWRWRYRVGDRYHHRFWAQLARWAATNKMAAGDDQVRFGLENATIEEGQPAEVKAIWSPLMLQQHPDIKVQAEFYKLDEKQNEPFTTIELAPTVGQPLRFAGQVVALPSGVYRVRLTSDQPLKGDKSIETQLTVTNTHSVELSDVSANRELLTQLADASGGRLFLLDEVKNLPDQFRKSDTAATTYEEITLWDRWPWLLVLFSLMTIEWVLRKLNGLP